MNRRFKWYLFTSIVLFVITVILISCAAGDTNFTNVLAEDVTASDDVSIGDDLAVGDEAVIYGATYLFGDVDVNSKFAISAASGNTDIAGTLQYGANDLYPVGSDTVGYQIVYGSDQITGTGTVTHGLTSPYGAVCTLGEDPTAGAGDGAMCTVTVSGSTVTIKVWQDDFVTAATEADVDVYWIVIGEP